MSEERVDFAACVIRRMSWGWLPRRNGCGFLMWHRQNVWEAMEQGEAEVYLNAIHVPSEVS